MTQVSTRVGEDIKVPATVDEVQIIKEFEDNYEENSKFVNVDDLKKRINMMLESVQTSENTRNLWNQYLHAHIFMLK